MHISIVSTLYKSEAFVDEFITRSLAELDRCGAPGELILVDDGSPDSSLARALNRANTDSRIIVIELTRNFGHHAALLTGLEHANGALIFVLDSDLEEPPELLTVFLEKMISGKADVVFGVHDQSKGPPVRRLTSTLFWRLFRAMSEVQTTLNICNARLMSRQYLNALLSLEERNVFLGGLYAWPGFRQIPFFIVRKPRAEQSTYTTAGRLSLFVRSIVAFSSRPLYGIFLLGVFIFSVSLFVGGYFLVYKLLFPDSVLSGFTAIIVSIWLLGGLTLSALGIIGMYLGHVYVETKGRPRTIVRATHSWHGENGKPHRDSDPEQRQNV